MNVLAADDTKVRRRVWMAWQCFILAAVQGCLAVMRPGEGDELLRIQQICFILAFCSIGRRLFWLFTLLLLVAFFMEMART